MLIYEFMRDMSMQGLMPMFSEVLSESVSELYVVRDHLVILI
jgi:hypothetical protein